MEFGHKIHASCKKTYFESKGRLLLVGVWRNIRNFQVRPAGGAYRTTNHIYKISFNQATVVSRSNFMNDDLSLNLVDFQSVLSGTLDEKYLIDVLGQVLDCGAVETIQCAGGNQRKKLEFTLRDIKIPCCIWGKLTDTLHSACNQDDGLVTLLLRDTGDDKNLMPYEINEDIQEYIKKQIDQADKRGQRDKFWLHLMVKDDTVVSKIMILDKVANGIVAESPVKLLNGSWDEGSVYLTDSQELNESVSTPSSKRNKDEAISLPDISSTSKKPCLMTVKIEKAEEAAKKRG
ncbi:hypothetical protein HID58_014845 [Brassica napus]|uniref:Replication protein A 70 kDa DNA-binding subunit B/D first OB fold domain-containing protein n=1 Tax=Brassica napus TaxID=3708 RepID=A0ABQ8DIS3_BRANA|nr:hypothetical protein HID58_014845 [Brassica napus]